VRQPQRHHPFITMLRRRRGPHGGPRGLVQRESFLNHKKRNLIHEDLRRQPQHTRGPAATDIIIECAGSSSSRERRAHVLNILMSQLAVSSALAYYTPYGNTYGLPSEGPLGAFSFEPESVRNCPIRDGEDEQKASSQMYSSSRIQSTSLPHQAIPPLSPYFLFTSPRLLAPRYPVR
jgi:hypothetical protein